jgi:hypothetical protein
MFYYYNSLLQATETWTKLANSTRFTLSTLNKSVQRTHSNIQLFTTGDRDLDEARQLHARQRVLGTLRRRKSAQGTRCQAEVHHHGMYRMCSLWIECVLYRDVQGLRCEEPVYKN